MSGLPGPEFWSTVYGYQDFDQFYDQVGRYIPSFSVFGVGLDRTAVAEVAYQSPSGTYGSLAIMIASVRGGAQPTDTQLNSSRSIAEGAITEGGYNRMAQLIIPGCFQVAIHAVSGGQPVDNVIGVQNSGGTAHGAALAVQTAWKVASGPLSLQASSYTLVDFTAVDIGSANGPIDVIGDAAAGGAGAVALSTAAACALIKWNGGTRSRSSRGRLYFGPLNEGQINSDGRTISSGALSVLNTAFTNFRNSLAASGYPLVVLSRTKATAYAVTQHAVEAQIATQRRRIRA